MPDTPIASPSSLSPENIEVANAHGPYTHGVWAGPKAIVGNEEALRGRGAFLASTIRRELQARFTPDQMASMTIVDVGCYDGWLLCQLEDLPFQRLIGVEPRQKNIDKGQRIRELLGITTRCEFRQGAIESLADTLKDVDADVVMCTGVFHHLASTSDGVASLHQVCRRFLFLETICFPAGLEDSRLAHALELKDLPYFFGSQQFGVSGHKLESGYYDGSATRMSVVSLPSVGALKMFLEVGGFTDVNVVADPGSYTEVFEAGYRRFSAVCLTASRAESGPDVTDWVRQYEAGVVGTVLDLSVMEALYAHRCLGQAMPDDAPRLARLLAATLSTDSEVATSAWQAIQAQTADRYGLEVMKNLRYAPADKIALEYGKSALAAGRRDDAAQVLLTVTRRLNADWRAVYRAFCLLSWVFEERGEPQVAERYRTLCLTANPGFPRELLSASRALLRPVAGENDPQTT